MTKPKSRFSTLLVWLVLVGVFFLAFMVYSSSKPRGFRDYESFVGDVELGHVAEVRVRDNEITYQLRDTRERYFTLGVLDDELTARLSAQGVRVTSGEQSGLGSMLLAMLLPAAAVVALLYFLARRKGGSVTDIFSLRKSLARPLAEASKVTFADVGGCQDAKLMLGDLIDFLRNPQRWTQAGVRLPRGVLLEGPPGCGKTLLARAVAGETSARFFVATASEFVEMFVGVGAARVRDTFDTARKQAPAVIFIDELDAVGRRRGSGIGSSHDEREQTLNQLLVCLDGFESREAVVVIAATNRPDILDPALLRPGRIDRRIKIPSLSREARLETLRIHSRNKRLAADVSLERLADQTEGFSGAQLENLANEAALLAVRRARQSDGQPPEVRMEDFAQALQPTAQQTRLFNKVDAVLIESTTQLAEPTGRAVVRLVLDGDSSLEGRLLWADAHFIKVSGDNADVIVPKAQIRRIESLPGTESIDPLDLLPDRWSGRPSGLA